MTLTRPEATVPIVRRTLVDAVTITGQVGYGDPTPLHSRATGTVTWLPETGAVVGRGEQLLRADDAPVVLMFGLMPMYRPMALNTTGTDVKQFEENLQALGHRGFTVDTRYGQDTVNVVKRWQHSLGLPQTGSLEPDRIVYAPGPLRVSERVARIGGDAQGEVLKVTNTGKLIVADVPAASAGWAAVGARLTAVLPNGASTTGVVADVRQPDPTSDASGNMRLTITVDNPDGLTASAVDLRHVVAERKDVLTVPVSALLALPQGGYGVELEDGTTLAVRTGLFAEGQVEVHGEGIAEGRRVGVPK